MSFGFFSLPRSLTRNSLWIDTPPAYKEVFLVILDLCVWKPTKFDDHGIIIDLLPGQICISERELKKKCGKYISRDDVKRSIKKFILYDFLHQEVRHKKSLITIIHKDTYDLISGSGEPESAPNLHQTCTKLAPERNKIISKEVKKKEKIDKKENPEKILFREKVTLTQEEFDKLKNLHGEKFVNAMLDELDSYKGRNKKEYDSDYFAMKQGSWVFEKIKKAMINGIPEKSFINGTQSFNGEPKFKGQRVLSIKGDSGDKNG